MPAVFSLFAASCASTKTVPATVAESKGDEDSLKIEAQWFDSYLSGALARSEKDEYRAKCEVASTPSMFCFTLREQNRLEKSFRSSVKKKNSRVPNTAAKVRFVKKKIANWPDIRFASVASLVKGLGQLSLNNLEAVRTYTMREKRCPNNAALAVASHYEDLLPDRILYSDVAKIYEKAAQCPMDSPDTVEMLWTRTGLLHLAAKNPKAAMQAFRKASETKASFKARSLYWLYKTQLENGDYKGAQNTFDELRENYPFSFHTLIALTNRNEDPGRILEQQKYTEKKRSETNEDVNRLLEQVEILHRYGHQNSASRLLDWAMALTAQQAEPELMVYISDLKEEQGDHVSKISLLSEVLYTNPSLISRVTMEKYFPKPYFPVFQNNAEGIDPFLLLAIARRESAFNPRAVSSANARGLLQVTPQTLRTLNSKYDLFEPSSNVNAGARLFGDLLKRVNGQIHLALAAYNAGPKRMSIWTERYPAEDPILFIDLIPYKETREYVAAVLRNYYWYQKLNNAERTPSPNHMLEYQGLEDLPNASRQSGVRPIQNVPE